MKHEFSDALRADPERFELSQKAAKLLDSVSLRSIVRATSHWRLPTTGSVAAPWNQPPYEVPVIEVELHDDQGTEHLGVITRYERDDPLELKYRISRIWGDLLEQRSFLTHIRYLEPASELGGVPE